MNFSICTINNYRIFNDIIINTGSIIIKFDLLGIINLIIIYVSQIQVTHYCYDIHI